MEEQFKVGSAYVTADGEVMQIMYECRDGEAHTQYLTGEHEGKSGGTHFLSDGRYVYAKERRCGSHLIPGELHHINGEWLPISVAAPVVEEKKEAGWLVAARARVQKQREAEAATATPTLDKLEREHEVNQRMIARDETYASRVWAHTQRIKSEYAERQAPKSTAHPSIPSLSLSPDRAGADHGLGARL